MCRYLTVLSRVVPLFFLTILLKINFSRDFSFKCDSESDIEVAVLLKDVLLSEGDLSFPVLRS